jgi:hypothetical protein
MLMRIWEKGTLINCWQECKPAQPLWKIIWQLLKKANIAVPYDSPIPLLGIYPNQFKSSYAKSTCTPMFIAALLTSQ